MSYINKYRSNKEWADLAYEKEEYDISINRYYYSVYQKILHELDLKNITIEVEKQQNSHNNTSATYASNLIQGKNHQVTFKTRTSFNSGFQSLKQLRYGADYKKHHSTQGDAKKAQKFFRQLDEII